MQLSFTDRLKHAWNVFKSRDPTDYWNKSSGYWSVSPYRPYYNKPYYGVSDHSIIAAIKNRIAVDAASVDIQHVRTDDSGRYVETINSGLNRCLNLSANIDQTGRAFRLDIFLSLLDEGVIALVPVDVDVDPNATGSYDIDSMRVGKIVDWRPKEVRVSCYNENTGERKDVIVPKKITAIVENPFYSVMNEPNSTFQRLIHKLALLDSVDEQASSGKLDLILQLPYVIKGQTRREQAERRRQEIEKQLKDSKYGIAYTDGTERIQQLNRPLENNLLSQIQYLTDVAYSQLGMTPEILNGTADEKTMLNYNNRIIEPLVAAVADSMKRTFLTKTAITQHQSIEYYKDPFSLVPVDRIAEIADKFTRNEIVTSNEMRQAIGMKPSSDPNADVLRNKNLYDTSGGMGGGQNNPMLSSGGEEEDSGPVTEEDLADMQTELDDLDAELDELEDSLTHWDSYNQEAKEYRRWYYENVEKPGLKLGYGNGTSTSTAGLNDEGKAYARYIKDLIDKEKNAAITSHKTSTDAQINKSKTDTDAAVEKSKKRRDYQTDVINEARDKTIDKERTKRDTGISASESERDRRITSANEERDKNIETARTKTQGDIATSEAERDKRITSANEARDRELESERARTKSEIEQHKSSTQMRIDVLRDQLSGLSKEEKAAVKDRIQNEIARLREDNAQKRADLQEALRTTSSSIRTKAKEESTAAREEHRKTKSELQEDLRTTSGNLRTKAKEENTAAREEHKKNKTGLQDTFSKNQKSVKSQAKVYTDKFKEEHRTESTALREGHKHTSTGLRQTHKDYAEKTRQDYKNAYAAELEYIKSLPKYQKVAKAKAKSEAAKANHTRISWAKEKK